MRFAKNLGRIFSKSRYPECYEVDWRDDEKDQSIGEDHMSEATSTH